MTLISTGALAIAGRIDTRRDKDLMLRLCHASHCRVPCLPCLFADIHVFDVVLI